MGMAATRGICGHMVDEEDALNGEGELFRHFSDKKIAAFVGNLVEIDAWGFVCATHLLRGYGVHFRYGGLRNDGLGEALGFAP